MSSRRLATLMMVMTGVVFVLCTAPVQGTLLTLSDISSNPFGYTIAENLDATLDFVVTDSQLTLTVASTGDSNPVGNRFTIIEVYLNYGGGVTGVAWAGAATNGWALEVNQDNIHVDNFGYYDVRLYMNPPPNKDIDPGDSETFILTIWGSPGTAEDFTTYFSAPNGGDILGLAAAKFNDGGPSGTEGAYGQAVPEPATILLLGLGGLALLRKRRT